MNPNKTRGIYENFTNKNSASFCWEESDVPWDSNQPIFAWILVVIGMILQPIIVLLNVTVIIVVKRRKELQQNSYILLSSMAIADLLTAVVMFPILVIAALLISRKFSLGLVCVLQAISTNVMACMLFSSLYHLAIVAWDRYVAVRKWNDYKVIVTKRRLKWLAKICWTLAVVTTIPGTIMDLKAIKPLVVYPLIIYRIVIVFTTFTAITYCYVLIYLTLRKRTTAPTSQVTALVQAKLQARVAKTTALITMSLFASMILPVVVSSIRQIFPAFRAILRLKMIGIAFQLNSLFNPLVYCYRDRRFRKAVLELLRIKNPRLIYPESSLYRQKNVEQSRAKPRENQFRSLRKSSSWCLSAGQVRKETLKRSTSCPAF
ncbi:adrenocorticotropic hormone receptor-like [Montipora foliosa]|uniref:adrenocorticotropic hormone receptor-like n=1 Tax=Montipora foliosa TaxID=591990 RepID=UPI0035F1C2FF